MVRQKTSFSPEYKMQIVLEACQSTSTLKQLAEKYHTSINNIQNWKNQFLQHAHLAFDNVVDTEDVEGLKKENARLEKLIEKMEQETQHAAEKLRQLNLAEKKQLIDTDSSELSIAQQCKIIDLNRPSLYYEPKPSNKDDDIIMQRIGDIYHRSTGTIGYRMIHKKLLEEGYKIGVNKVHKLMKILDEQNALIKSSSVENKPDLPMQSHLLHDLALVKPFKL